MCGFQRHSGGGGSQDVTKVSMPSNDITGHLPCVLPVLLSLALLRAEGAAPHGPVNRLPCLWVSVGFYQKVSAGIRSGWMSLG